MINGRGGPGVAGPVLMTTPTPALRVLVTGRGPGTDLVWQPSTSSQHVGP
jgi:hypothetical protein